MEKKQLSLSNLALSEKQDKSFHRFLSPELNRVVDQFQEYLHLPDPTPLVMTLATVAANSMPGDPVWLLLIGPPGSGKTEILNSTLKLPNMHSASTLTEAGLLSGTSMKDTPTQ